MSCDAFHAPCKTAFNSYDMDAWVDGSFVKIQAFGLFWQLSFIECEALAKDIRSALMDEEQSRLSRFEVEFDYEYDSVYILNNTNALIIDLDGALGLCEWLEKVIG